MSDNESKIVKAPFVAMSDIRKEIKTIAPDDPKILGRPKQGPQEVASESGDVDGEQIGMTTEEGDINEAINDEVIDGSYAIILEEAKKEAEELRNQIIEQANVDAETIREAARQDGYEAGYAEGQRASSQELEQKMQELEAKGIELEQDFEDAQRTYMDDMEPRVAYVIRDLVYKMIGVYEDDPAIIIYLIKLALEEVHTYGSFVIKVSAEDYDYVIENKEKIVGGLSEKVDVEILKDVDMTKNQCFLQTEMGNIDCSLDLRLESLMRELKLIGDSLK